MDTSHHQSLRRPWSFSCTSRRPLSTIVGRSSRLLAAFGCSKCSSGAMLCQGWSTALSCGSKAARQRSSPIQTTVANRTGHQLYRRGLCLAIASRSEVGKLTNGPIESSSKHRGLFVCAIRGALPLPSCQTSRMGAEMSGPREPNRAYSRHNLLDDIAEQTTFSSGSFRCLWFRPTDQRTFWQQRAPS